MKIKILEDYFMDKRIKILIISAGVLIVGGIAVGLLVNKDQDVSGAEGEGTPQLTIKEKRFDLGDVSMADGLAFRKVELKNSGTADLEISSIKTSCMCTQAVLEVEGKKSPKFGMHTSSAFWSENIKPGQSANLEVIFDPNAHGPNATGPITRTVTLVSNDGGKAGVKTNITFTAKVIK